MKELKMFSDETMEALNQVAILLEKDKERIIKFYKANGIEMEEWKNDKLLRDFCTFKGDNSNKYDELNGYFPWNSIYMRAGRGLINSVRGELGIVNNEEERKINFPVNYRLYPEFKPVAK